MAAALDIGGMSYSPIFLSDINSHMLPAVSDQNFAAEAAEPSVFEVADYVAFDESAFVEESAAANTLMGGHGDVPADDMMMMMMNCGHDAKRMRVGVGCRIGFRTKSEVEILDDGFKWRKYGKKSVKNSPNPRNYFRCSSEGCGVKKRVERDREDPRFVITAYEGVHNHISPWSVYDDYAHHLPVNISASVPWGRTVAATPAAVSSSWTVQSAQSSF